MKKHNKNIKNRFSSNPYHPVLLAPPCLPPCLPLQKKKKKKKEGKNSNNKKHDIKLCTKK